MKKILFSLMCVMILFIVTGCGDKSTHSDIEHYLKEHYPNESFKIVSQEKVSNIKTSGECSTDKSGYKYNILSNTTDIQFIVEDVYEYSSYGTCDYDLTDNYYQVALEKYIIDFNDSRINLDTHMLNSDIKVDYKNFKSINEISNALYNFKTYYESKNPFIEEANVSVYIYNSENYLGSISLSYNNREITLDIINKEISNLLQ